MGCLAIQPRSGSPCVLQGHLAAPGRLLGGSDTPCCFNRFSRRFPSQIDGYDRKRDTSHLADSWTLHSSSTMAVFQKLVITLLTLLTVAFLYFAQVAEAAGKGPRITNKVSL